MQNRSEAEASYADLWERTGVYQFQADDTSKPIFSVDNPPPYISATHLHAGHAMSFTQADIVVRYQRMKGFNIFYPLGFDDNGLPTERFVEKQHKVSGRHIGKQKFVELCLQETARQTETYRRLFKKLGISVITLGCERRRHRSNFVTDVSILSGDFKKSCSTQDLRFRN